LYGLLDVYRLKGNVAGVMEMQDTILKLWDDKRVISAVQDYLRLVEEQKKASSTKGAAAGK
jgi:23S rRNA A2030 N6-methylase RlmJ